MEIQSMADMNDPNVASVHWDPFNQTYFYNPYPVFKNLREKAPIYYNEECDFYAVSRYDECQMVLGDRDTYISRHGEVYEHIKERVPMPKGMFICEDPPLHTVHRSVLARIFTPKRMQALEPQIREYCARTLDPLVAGGEFDFILDLGAVMPTLVIGMLLGIPESQLEVYKTRLDEKAHELVLGKPMEADASQLTGEHFADYLNWREKNPSDDAMTELLNVEFVDETGVTRKLTKGEILVFTNLLFGAGNDTTNKLIGWMGKVLAEHPDQRRAVRQDRSLIPQTIEELLRFQSPGPSVARYVAKDTEVLGVKVPEGSIMLSLVASGNRDESKFVDGDSFNIHRERVPHLSFGFGFHNCLGNALARVEGRAALDEILNRFPEWDVDLENAIMRPSTTVRGWDKLPAHTPRASRAA
jgi:cytochrome P450